MPLRAQCLTSRNTEIERVLRRKNRIFPRLAMAGAESLKQGLAVFLQCFSVAQDHCFRDKVLLNQRRAIIMGKRLYSLRFALCQTHWDEACDSRAHRWTLKR